MKILIVLISSLLMLSGCVTAQQDRAATRGAVVGATAGAVIGAPEGKAAEGALFGGLMGAAAGAILAGNRSDYKRSPRYYHRHQTRHHFDDDAYLRRYAHDD